MLMTIFCSNLDPMAMYINIFPHVLLLVSRLYNRHSLALLHRSSPTQSPTRCLLSKPFYKEMRHVSGTRMPPELCHPLGRGLNTTGIIADGAQVMMFSLL